MVTDIPRIANEGDFGEAVGPLTQDIVETTQRIHLAGAQFQEWSTRRILGILNELDNPDKKVRKVAAELLEVIGRKDKATRFNTTTPPQNFLAYEDIQKIVKGLSIENQIKAIRLAQESRVFFDEMHELMNLARLKRGHDAIPYIDFYRPHIRETHDWGTVGGWLEQSPLDERAVPDFIKPNKVFNARELHRKSGIPVEELEGDITKLLMSYADSTKKDIYNTEIIRNVKRHTKPLRENGYPNLADAFDTHAYEAYAGVPTTPTRFIRSLWIFNRRLPLPLGKTIRLQKISPKLDRTITIPGPKGRSTPSVIDSILIFRQNLTRAVFPLNVYWNTFIQTSSGALTALRYGTRNSIKATDVFFNKKLMDEIKNKSYSYKIKTQQRSGTVIRQDLGDEKLKLRKSKLDSVTDVANFLSTTIEKLMTAHATRAAYLRGEQLGYKGRDLWQFASQGGARTQSMYNREDAVGFLRSREMSALFPFQTFAFEMMNTVREISAIKGFRTGAYRTISANSKEGQAILGRRLKQVLTGIALAVAINYVTDKAIDRKPWSMSSFIPMLSLFYGGFSPLGNTNGVLPWKLQSDFRKGLNLWFKNGDATGFREFFFKYGVVPGGIQLNKSLNGFIAVKEGGVRYSSGVKKFDVEKPELKPVFNKKINPVEFYNVYLGGVYQTNGGREYLEKRLDRTPLEDFLQLDLPDSLFGGKTEGLRKKWKQEINQYYNIPSDYKKLSSAEKTKLKDRFGVTSDRITFRKRNPEIDAHLFIAGNVSSLQTLAARRIAKEIIIEENIKATDLDEDRLDVYKNVLTERWVISVMGAEKEIQELPPKFRDIEPIKPYDFSKPAPTPTPTPTPQPASSNMAEENWEKISAVLTQSDLIALQKVWSGGILTREETASLRKIHSTPGLNLGQDNFKTWMKQTLRQVQQNAAVAKKMRNTRELVTV